MIYHGKGDPENNTADFIVEEIIKTVTWLFRYSFWFIVFGLGIGVSCICPPVGICIAIAILAYWMTEDRKE